MYYENLQGWKMFGVKLATRCVFSARKCLLTETKYVFRCLATPHATRWRLFIFLPTWLLKCWMWLWRWQSYWSSY